MADTVYRSQREAMVDARIGIWGDLPLSRRECIVPSPTVTANVNHHLVAIHFDNYGRLTVSGIHRI